MRAFGTVRIAYNMHNHPKKGEEKDDALAQLEIASRTSVKLKAEPLPLRDAELHLRGNDAWQIRCFLLPLVFDDTDTIPNQRRRAVKRPFGGYGTMWSFGTANVGNVLTFTYPSANATLVHAFFRDLTRARAAAALSRGTPHSRFFRVQRRSPMRVTVQLKPFSSSPRSVRVQKPIFKATAGYLYSKGNSGGFSVTFQPSMPTMDNLAPLIEEALDVSGGSVGFVLAGLLERACPIAAATDSAICENGEGRIRFVTALRVRAVFTGKPISIIPNNKEGQSSGTRKHAIDLDARGKRGFVAIVDVGKANAVMFAQGFAPRGNSNMEKKLDFSPLPQWEDLAMKMCKEGKARPQKSASTLLLKMEALEEFLFVLVARARSVSST